MSVETLYREGNDNCKTPRWLMSVFADWYDPCPLNGVNGLTSEWGKKTFVNPPYSNPLPWVEKSIEESRKGKTIVMLVKVDTSTKWWFKLVESGARFAPFLGRLRFNDGEPAPFPSTLVFLTEVEKK